MINRKHLYVGHMFSDGMTTLDASDPRNLKPVNFFTAGANTRTHHLQVAERSDAARQRRQHRRHAVLYDQRGYFENTLADSITNRKTVPRGTFHP